MTKDVWKDVLKDIALVIPNVDFGQIIVEPPRVPLDIPLDDNISVPRLSRRRSQ